jgi:hypothetical protein
MATGFLTRLRCVARHAFGLTAASPGTAPVSRLQAGGRAPSLLSRLTASDTSLVRADAGWRPQTQRLRVEIMASGPFENLRGIRCAVNQFQKDLAGAVGNGTLELRLTEVRRTCRHVTAWSRSPVDPGAAATEWECLEEALGDEPENRTLFAQAFRDSVRNGANHVVLFGNGFDDGTLYLSSAVRTFRARGVRVSAFCLGGDFTARTRYRFLAAGTGGLYLALPAGHSLDGGVLDPVLKPVLPIVAAFACGDHARLAALPAPTPEARALMKQVRGA